MGRWGCRWAEVCESGSVITSHSIRHCWAAFIVSLSLSGCSRDAPREQSQTEAAHPPVLAAASAPSVSPAQAGWQQLYVVYCNGTVDVLDLAQQAKVESFQLASRSGTPPAVAKLRSPGVSPDSCLARPGVPDGVDAPPAGVAYVVASNHVDRSNTDGSKPYSLLTFAVPGWTLQGKQELGSFDVLNGTPPRIARGADGRMEVLPDGQDTAAATLAEAVQFPGGQSLEFVNPLAWSANKVLIQYAAPRTGGSAFALVDRARKSIVRIDGVPGGDPEPSLTLAPGGRYVLHTVRHMIPADGGQKLVATGELRLYGEDGKLVNTRTETRVAGAWHAITIAPHGLVVFTNRQGGYHFVRLGLTFDPKPVLDRLTDDIDGSRPGIIYTACLHCSSLQGLSIVNDWKYSGPFFISPQWRASSTGSKNFDGSRG